MRQHFLILTFLILAGIRGSFIVHADDDPISGADMPQSYDTYRQLLENQCDRWDKDTRQQLWNNPKEGGPIMSPPDYARLETRAINTSISRTIVAENLPSEKEKLARELDSLRIGNNAGLKSLEVARLQYRSAMNNTFACAIIDSRTQILADLRKKISEKFPGPKDEIIVKLEKEEKKLQATRNTLPCATSEESANNAIPIETKIRNTAARQYCHYSYYLLYLGDNLEKDNNRMMQIEKGVGTGNGTNIPTNSDDWIREFTTRTSQISNELARATNTLPRVLRTFQEMKRTYALHIMLIIIYDDYLRLREDLSTYLNASSQLFEKAFNAQSTNKG